MCIVVYDSWITSVLVLIPSRVLAARSDRRWPFIGTRGATSAEYFLQAGYAVIFMHRQFSLQPFSRHYSHSTHPFLDFLDIDPADTDGHKISVTSAEQDNLLKVLTSYKQVELLMAQTNLHEVLLWTVGVPLYQWTRKPMIKLRSPSH